MLSRLSALLLLLFATIQAVSSLIIRDWQPSSLPLAVKTVPEHLAASRSAAWDYGQVLAWRFNAMGYDLGQFYALQGNPNPTWPAATQVQLDVSDVDALLVLELTM